MQNLLLGFQKGLCEHPHAKVKQITFVTTSERDARMLQTTLNPLDFDFELRYSESPAVVAQTLSGSVAESIDSPNKKRVLVTMPCTDEFENVYEYGVYPAVRKCGLICERIDHTHSTSQIRQSIGQASLMIADLTVADLATYLQVGYALGSKTRVLILARRGETLPAFLNDQKCLFYSRFATLASELEQFLTDFMHCKLSC